MTMYIYKYILRAKKYIVRKSDKFVVAPEYTARELYNMIFPFLL